MNRLRGRIARLEQRASKAHGGLTDEDRAHMAAWSAHTEHKYRGGPPPTPEQVELRDWPGFWERLQEAWGRPAFARACMVATEAARRDFGATAARTAGAAA
jgi:hypothetical protein